MTCTPSNKFANCPMKRSGRLDACHEPGGCLARPMTTAEEVAIATVFATPQFKAIRHLVERLSLAEIDKIVKRVRVSVWRDFSAPD